LPTINNHHTVFKRIYYNQITSTHINQHQASLQPVKNKPTTNQTKEVSEIKVDITST